MQMPPIEANTLHVTPGKPQHSQTIKGPLRAWAGLIVFVLYSISTGAADTDQGWNSPIRDPWYESTQGSRLIPLSWFKALEQPGSKEPFLADPYILKYGYVPYDLRYGGVKHRLPRGFVIDNSKDDKFTFSKLRWIAKNQRPRQPWVGMTCAACHTATISYKSAKFDVDGGPTVADFQSFFENFRLALVETSASADKFDRFANAVLKGANSQENRQSLLSELKKFNTYLAKSAALNETSLRYGPGRLDAVGHILNKIALLNGAANPSKNPSDAPVSYPFLWNVPQHDRVQWNGMAKNHRLATDDRLDVGALGRNTGEVIGVFADVRAIPDPGLDGYVSSVNAYNLDGLERRLKKLRPPRWPADVFGALDANLVSKGRDVFREKGCATCHAVLRRDDLESPIEAKMIKIASDEDENGKDNTIATDPWMACNAFQFESDSGVMEGMDRIDGSGKIAKRDKLADMLSIAAKQSLLGQKFVVAELITAGFFGIRVDPEPAKPWSGILLSRVYRAFSSKSEKEVRLDKCYAAKAEILAYKARPLNGIWATPPYLHNGSVSSLYELLLPSSQRLKKFNTGTTEFEPVKVGFQTAPSDNNHFSFDTSLEGNRNSGHEYGVNRLTEAERWALVEYMKSL